MPAIAPPPGTVQTASSANRPRSASPSLRAKASKILRTRASFSGAATRLLPARDQPLDMLALRLREVHARDQSARLVRIVVRDRGLEMLAQRRRLAELSSQPSQETHSRLALQRLQPIRVPVCRLRIDHR